MKSILLLFNFLLLFFISNSQPEKSSSAKGEEVIISGNCYGLQINAKDSMPGNSPGRINKKINNTSFKFHCLGSNRSNNDPLYVIDGIPVELNQVKELHLAEIVNIYILKDAAASAIYGIRAASGVVIITTNRSDKDFVLISDQEDHSPIAGATCLIRSKDNYFDSTIAVSDSAGKIYRKQFPKASGYEVTVTSVGYTKQSKTISTFDLSNKEKIEMFRDIKKCSKVVVISGTIKCYRTICYMFCTTSTCGILNECQKKAASGIQNRMYPNPVSKGQYFTIEINSSIDQPLTAKIISFSGQLMKQESVKLNKGNNIFQMTTDSRWAAGVYIVQLNDPVGKSLKQDKIVVQ